MKGYPNLLPHGGEVFYESEAWGPAEREVLFQILREDLDWRCDEVVMFGKRVITQRKVAWYGDKHFRYKYSGLERTAKIWHPSLLPLKHLAEEVTGSRFNCCLCNLYHHGGEGMSWHSDNDKEFGIYPVIASVSFGAARPFRFRHKNGNETVDLRLEPGSLLLMRGGTQENWLHALPKSKRVKEMRINLTFRYCIDQT